VETKEPVEPGKAGTSVKLGRLAETGGLALSEQLEHPEHPEHPALGAVVAVVVVVAIVVSAASAVE